METKREVSNEAIAHLVKAYMTNSKAWLERYDNAGDRKVSNFYGYGIVDCDNESCSNCYRDKSGAENICKQINKAYALSPQVYKSPAPYRVVRLYYKDSDE